MFRCEKNSWAGLNIDFEPSDPKTNATQDDAQNYAIFLNRFSDAMHQGRLLPRGPTGGNVNGFRLSVDTARWSTIWNMTELAATEIDTLITMDTYTSNLNGFASSLKQVIELFDVLKLLVLQPI